MASTTSLLQGLILSFSSLSNRSKNSQLRTLIPSLRNQSLPAPRLKAFSRRWRSLTISAALPPLDLTEENIRQVLIDARSEFAQLFDTSVGITGQVDLAELDVIILRIESPKFLRWILKMRNSLMTARKTFESERGSHCGLTNFTRDRTPKFPIVRKLHMRI
ncbi:hypothetical protein OPV22_017495 [Ensete ventricosum]|uniref:Uncharacterized protein n=1 Tax=Ensete ventricosum TaxID=4639 RepID=A0AAV8QZU8_ENSVE|nr:hypothetical protein OPV22_017495 [Ensete ventricosum]